MCGDDVDCVSGGLGGGRQNTIVRLCAAVGVPVLDEKASVDEVVIECVANVLVPVVDVG